MNKMDQHSSDSELKVQKEILTNLLINLKEGILLEDASRKIVLTNQMFCNLFSIPAPPEALIGADCSMSAEQSKHLFKDPVKFVADIDQLLKNQLAVYGDILELTDGQFFERDYIPTYVEGLYSGHLWRYRDITLTKKEQEKLITQEQNYHSIFQVCPDGIIIADAETTMFSYANTAQCNMFGYSVEEFMTMGIESIHPKEHFERIRLEFGAMLNGENNFVATIECLKKNGETFIADISSVVVSIDGKKQLLGFFRDVTDRNKAEMEIMDLNMNLESKVMERTNSLNESRNRLAKIADCLPGVVYQFQMFPDGSSCFPYASEGIRNIYRVSPEAAMNDAACVFATLHPDDFEDVVTSIKESSLDLSIWKKEYRVKFNDGTIRWLNGNAMPQKQTDGSILWHGYISDVTDRKQVESDLEENREKYRGLSEATFEAIFISEKGYCIEQNLAAQTIFGYTSEEALMMKGTEWIVEEDRNMVMNKMLEGVLEPYEATALKKDGTTFPCILHGKMMYYKGRTVRVTSLNDITERKRAEILLENARQNFETFFNTIDDFLFVLDEQGNMIHINDTVIRRLQYSMEELLNKSVLIVHPEERRTEAGQIVSEMLAGTAEFCPVPLITKTGDHIAVETRVRTGLWDGKKVIFGVSKDVSKIRLSEEKFSKAFQSNYTLIAISNFQGKLLEANYAFLNTLGYEIEEVIGKTAMELNICKDDSLINLIKEHIFKNVPLKDVELEISKKDGTNITVLFSADSINIGDEMCFLTMFVNITERKHAELEINIARSEAENANIAKSEFLSRMSHELRTPMNSILGFAQLLNLDELNSKQKKQVNHILTSGTHLLNLINEVLDISRIESGRLSLSLEPIQLYAVIMEMLDVVNPLLIKQDQHIELIVSPTNLLFVKADLLRLKQVLLNLINNAIKYNRESGSVVIKTELMNGDDPVKCCVRISVIDTGIGIHRDDFPRLFQPFERIGADVTGKEGTGLGLAVVKKLMDAMGGSVGLESELGEGSTFWIELPCVNRQKKSRKNSPLEMNERDIIKEKEGSILYIEDNISNTELVQEILEVHRPGVRLVTSIYGRQAYMLAKENMPDLILLDLNLPDMHGSEVMEILKGSKETKSIPVVIISADAIPKNIENLKQKGANEYLSKPIDVLSFLKMIDVYIE